MWRLPQYKSMRGNISPNSIAVYVKIGLVSILLLNLTACFGKGKSAEAIASSEPSVDMTRPPTTIKGSDASAEESNPDETISFEKWKKERQDDEK